MPDTMSIERQKLLTGYGAEIVLTEGKLGMQGAIDRARELAAQYPGSFIPDQFANPANPAAHEATTGPEIWEATDGQVDIFVAGVGTGGTLTGVGRYFKKQNPGVQLVAVEPASSPLLSGGKENFSQFRLDYYPDRVDPKLGVSPRAIMERNLRTCRTYANTFSSGSGNLLFNGGTGLGKTFLSACIARSVADKGFSVLYETATHLFNKLEQAKFSPSDETRHEAAKLGACDLLIVDDLGTEMPGQFVTAALYSLLNDRLLAGKPMIISTNLNVDEIQRRYSPQIASRLQGSFHQLIFLGEDIRILKNRGF